MSELRHASPVQLALRRFWSQRGSRVGVWIILAFVVLGVYAPFLASETALLWWDETGWYFPVIEELFNRLRYAKHYDLFFNITALALPIILPGWLVLRRKIKVGRYLSWCAGIVVALFFLLQIPLMPPSQPGGDWRAVWTERPLSTHSWTSRQQIGEMEQQGVAQAAQRQDVLIAADGEQVRVMFQTQKPVDANGNAIVEGAAPADAEQRTFVVVRPIDDPRAVPRYLAPDNLRPVVPKFTFFPLIKHYYDLPYQGAVLATPFTTNTVTGEVFLLGADASGQDILARMFFGARISLTIGVVATVIAMTIGIIIGAISGYFGGWIDIFLQRIVEIMMMFPSFLLVLIIVAMVGRDIMVIMMVFGLTGWAGTARLVRGEFMSQMGREYVLAGRTMGLPRWRIMFRHILPNTMTPLFISAAFSVAGTILSESGLSFLGLVDSRTPSWGLILSAGRQSPEYAHIIYTPGLAIFALVSALNLVGNGLREAFDPKGSIS